jgi:hypothetical protein
MGEMLRKRAPFPSISRNFQSWKDKLINHKETGSHLNVIFFRDNIGGISGDRPVSRKRRDVRGFPVI